MLIFRNYETILLLIWLLLHLGCVILYLCMVKSLNIKKNCNIFFGTSVGLVLRFVPSLDFQNINSICFLHVTRSCMWHLCNSKQADEVNTKLLILYWFNWYFAMDPRVFLLFYLVGWGVWVYRSSISIWSGLLEVDFTPSFV